MDYLCNECRRKLLVREKSLSRGIRGEGRVVKMLSMHEEGTMYHDIDTQKEV